MEFLRSISLEYELDGIQRELMRLGYQPVEQPMRKSAMRVGRLLARMAGLVRLFPGEAAPVLIPGGNLPIVEFVPFGFYRPLILWRYDVWEPDYPGWERYLRQTRSRLAFFTARQAAEEIGRRVPECECLWLPECVALGDYLATTPLAARRTDVLELGRKYDRIHAQIRPRLEATGKVHLYERVKGQMIYPTKQQMVEGLADAKIVLCYPSSVTHPERSGNVETLTHRYLQTMASGALVVGKAPAELVDIFGYNPVVELRESDAADHLLEILDHITEYSPLVERNLARVKEVATTRLRVSQLTALLRERGYKVPAIPD
jgi:hypothetical protein